MDRVEAAYERLIRKFVEWSKDQADIRGLVVLGSRARVDHPADEWSDLDIMVVTNDPDRHLLKIGWLGNVGEVLLTFLEPTSIGGETERRALFKGMLDVDFAIIPKAKIEKLMGRRASQKDKVEVADVVGRGVRVLLDKDGLLAKLGSRVPPSENLAPCVPSEEEFVQVVSDFLYHGVWTAKKLRRSELWTAKSCCDGYMKRLLLRMIEWHFHAVNGGGGMRGSVVVSWRSGRSRGFWKG